MTLSLLIAFNILPIFRFGYGFINVENLRQHERQGFKGKSSLGFTGRSGNVNKLQGELETLNSLRDKKKEYLLSGRYKYGQNNKVKNTNEGNFHLRFTYYFSHFFPVETYGQMEFDQFKLLEIRKILGIGLRFKIMETKKQFFYLGWGGFYEYERIDVATTENTQKKLRKNIYLSYLFLSDKQIGRQKVFSIVIYYQPSLEVFFDYRLQIDGGLSIDLGDLFSLENKVFFRRDNRPPPAIKADDIGYLTGISFQY